jgi:hypothetical protein
MSMFGVDQPVATTYTEPRLSRQTCVWDLHRGQPEATQILHRARQNLSGELERACLGLSAPIHTLHRSTQTPTGVESRAGRNAVFHTKFCNGLPPRGLDIPRVLDVRLACCMQRLADINIPWLQSVEHMPYWLSSGVIR